MSGNHSAVGVFDSHEEAEEAEEGLQHSGLDMKQLSIVGRNFHSEEHVVGYYNTGDRVAFWGKLGAFWGGLWVLLFARVGAVLVGGPLVAAIVAALEGASVVGGLSAIGAGLYSLGIPKNSVPRYESALRTDKYLLIINGTAQEVAHAREIMDRAKATESAIHS